jgi:hypothetical protein
LNHWNRLFPKRQFESSARTIVEKAIEAQGGEAKLAMLLLQDPK